MALRLLHYSDVENAYDAPERIGRLAGAIERRRDSETVLAGTGDNTAPGVLSLVTDGRQALDFFAEIDPDVDTFGNHDFDHGYDGLRRLVDESPQTWVSANVELDGQRFGADAGAEPWTVVEAGPHEVGVVGVTTPTTPSITPTASDLTVTKPIPAVADAAAELRDRGVDYVVVLAHMADDERIAAECDVDAVLGGHTHTERVARVGGAVLTRPAANGESLYEITFDGDEPAARRHAVADAPIDEAVAAALRERKTAADLDTVVDTVARPVERTHETAFRGESRVGNFVADAYRWASDADVGLQNSGGIRAGEPLSGEVTVADLISVVPFEEPIVVAEVSGAELRSICRQASGSTVELGEPEWWHAHVSGAEIVWDGAEAALETVRVDGAPVAPDATYTVATSEYLLGTDHEFPALDASHRVETLDIQYDVLVEYARERGVDPAIEGRVRRLGVDTPATTDGGDTAGSSGATGTVRPADDE
ncbi:2',3'-cyclic-nucleotide 2'-phosphodiesterase/5'-or 3'-nucleotidase, 5'-nucleotidase family [Natronoarchaeum philippinense]|uniref:2',3'-cyclic-nucleotide 2'-phosphodiesterase/5'-or 3'-nucleotidase, 5'-nucleotidase family n=1 Tax=Natronoarchaeum philippinense TaxID=558529 RepID=A0A285N4E1_NATPI|nr:bifunctional metallophosphatase/5'-nucleotidase [Natronoarchaeum philippinense]SNZ04300.1 2',3'-cyclic-nucleotide 2'-phosphodiesterase/5'-or 3'-nucleotidase, 5'-nucleotidase family [Natronoarchaeum philippinense]